MKNLAWQGDDDYLTFNSLDDIRNTGSIGGYTPEEEAALPQQIGKTVCLELEI